MNARLAVIAVMLLAPACAVESDPGPMEHETKTLELDRSTHVHVELRMGTGELRVEGGSPKLLEADFGHSAAIGAPTVDYRVDGTESEIDIDQPSAPGLFHNARNNWVVTLNDQVPTEVALHVGAGSGHIRLGSLNLRGVELNLGVGEVQLDLRGHPAHSYDAEIHGGVGEATVYLPTDVAIAAVAHRGIGEVEVRGLEQRGDVWINPAHESAAVTLHVDVTSGVGAIRLIAE